MVSHQPSHWVGCRRAVPVTLNTRPATAAAQACINSAPRGQRPSVLVSSSAVGFYGTSEGATFTEGSSNGSDYLAEVRRSPVTVLSRCTASMSWPCGTSEVHFCTESNSSSGHLAELRRRR